MIPVIAPPDPGAMIVDATAGEETASVALLPVAACSSLAAIAAVALLAGQGALQAWILGACTLCVPGVFVARRATAYGPAATVALVVSVSTTAWMVLAHLLLSVEWWRPRVASTAACLACAGVGGLLVWRASSAGSTLRSASSLPCRPRIDRVSLVRLVVLAAAIGLWWSSLGDVDVAGVGHWGLVTQLPVAWIVALVLAVAVVAAASIDPRSTGLVYAAGLGTVLTIVYGTLPRLVSTARYPWSYKHIGVIRLLSETGHLHPQVDIYNNFSGFFGLGALLRSATGVDPTSYAPWAQLVAETAVVCAVVALVSTIGGSRRGGRVAGVLYVMANWVGQNYFAPQALGSLLALTVLTFTWAWFATGATRSLPVIGWMVGALGPVERGSTPEARHLPPGARLLVAFVFLGLMMTHPLTPTAVCGALAGAVVVGWVRDRRLLALVAIVAIGWLVRCAPYFAAQDFDLGFGGDPSENATGNLDYRDAPRPVVLVGLVTRAFSLGLWAAAVAAALYCVWARRRPGGLLLVAVVPFGIPLVQSYGGEAVYRVYLYSLPLVVGLIACAIVSWSPRRARDIVAWQRRLAVVTALALVPGFLVAHFGREEVNQVAPSEVAMEEWIARSVPRPALLAQFGDNYPAHATAAYPELIISDTYTPQVTTFLGPRRTRPTVAELDAVADDLVALSPHRVYVVVAPGMVRSVVANAALPITSTSDAIALLTGNPRFTVVHRIDDTWLLEVQR
jgi:hypothetical protein